MEDKEKERERRISILESEQEELEYKSKAEEKKALIREYKAKYGRDWRHYFRWMKSLKVDKESADTLFGNSKGALREMNDPRAFRR